MNYTVHHCATAPALTADWNDPAWNVAETLEIKHFRPESSAHRPQTLARLLFSEASMHGIFLVRDRYVRCARQHYFDDVWKDSCVEFFVQPKSGQGYFNFEFNCGGAFLCNYITDWRLKNGWFTEATKLPLEIGQKVQVKSSLPRLVDPELTEPTDWTLQFFIPFGVLENYVGALGERRGQTWRGNFFKCAEEISHPHWAAWSAVDEFNFHLPRCFGELRFAG